MKLLWNVLAFFVALAACQQNATQQEELQRALQLISSMPECSVRYCETLTSVTTPGADRRLTAELSLANSS